MNVFLFLTIILFYNCNNLTSANYEAAPSSSQTNEILQPQPSLLTSTISKQEEELPDPISSVDIDYLKNGLLFQFRRSIKSDNSDIETRRRSVLDKNFMRFGRGNENLMRFGRSDNLMRFGRANGNNLMRFGRSSANNRMRFGKRDKNLMRFGRAENLMRFGRSGNLMDVDMKELQKLFGRGDRNDNSNTGRNILFYGSLSNKHAMRLGKRDDSEKDEGLETSIKPLKSSINSINDTDDDENMQNISPLKILFNENGNKLPIVIKTNSEPTEENYDTDNYPDNSLAYNNE